MWSIYFREGKECGQNNIWSAQLNTRKLRHTWPETWYLFLVCEPPKISVFHGQHGWVPWAKPLLAIGARGAWWTTGIISNWICWSAVSQSIWAGGIFDLSYVKREFQLFHIIENTWANCHAAWTEGVLKATNQEVVVGGNSCLPGHSVMTM